MISYELLQKVGTVEIRGTHPFHFRHHQWAQLMGVIWFRDRACYEVQFEDGAKDWWPVIDPVVGYEFRQSAEVT